MVCWIEGYCLGELCDWGGGEGVIWTLLCQNQDVIELLILSPYLQVEGLRARRIHSRVVVHSFETDTDPPVE